VLPPGGRRTSSDVGSTTIVEIAAQLNHFTDRPDLFLETIEKHDPGFIKKMNAQAESFSRTSRDARFRFGQAQAYAALGVSVIGALATLSAVMYLIATNQAGFWSLVGL
jgi:hypothetical protein